MGFIAAVIEQMGIAAVRDILEKLLEEVCFALPTIGPESLMARAPVVGDKHTDQIAKAAGMVPFPVHVDMRGGLRHRWLGHNTDAVFSSGPGLQREGVGAAAR